MNNITRGFASGALEAEGRLNRSVDELEQRNSARAKLDAVEEAWVDAAADASIDSEELSQLQALLTEAGLGDAAKQLNSLAPGEGLKAQVDDILSGGLKRARRKLGEGELELRTMMQLHLTDVTQGWADASNSSRIEHQAQMNIISNMKA